MFFLLFLLDDGRIWIQSRIRIRIYDQRIRIRIREDKNILILRIQIQIRIRIRNTAKHIVQFSHYFEFEKTFSTIG
jgi:hypothetical protein